MSGTSFLQLPARMASSTAWAFLPPSSAPAFGLVPICWTSMCEKRKRYLPSRSSRKRARETALPGTFFASAGGAGPSMIAAVPYSAPWVNLRVLLVLSAWFMNLHSLPTGGAPGVVFWRPPEKSIAANSAQLWSLIALLSSGTTAEIGWVGFGCCMTPPALFVVFVSFLLLLPQPVAASAVTAQQSAALLIPLPTLPPRFACRANPGRKRPVVKAGRVV